jgi:hypothetical protein
MKKHTKRYMVIFSMWGKSPTARDMQDLYQLKEYSHSETEFNTEAEWKEEVKLIEEVYADTPRPYKVPNLRSKRHEEIWEFKIESRFWGYLVLDFEKNKILKTGGDGIYKYHGNVMKICRGTVRMGLEMLDDFFRGDDEIPKGYLFDTGEYEGWLQYRWGDGKNAVICKQETCKKPRKKKYGLHVQFDESELEDEFDATDAIQEEYEKKAAKQWVADNIDKW